METFKLTLTSYISTRDFRHLSDIAIPHKAIVNGKEMEARWEKDERGFVVFELPLLKIREINELLAKYGIYVDKKQIERLSLSAEKGEKEEMPIKIELAEQGFNVHDKTSATFVLFSNVQVILDIFSESQEAEIMPRRMWAKLVEKYDLFPYMRKAIKIVANARIDENEKTEIISGLFQHQASAFEGLRQKTRKDKPDSNQINYYSLYWYPIIILKNLGYLNQIGRSAILLKRNDFENWQELAYERYGKEGSYAR